MRILLLQSLPLKSSHLRELDTSLPIYTPVRHLHLTRHGREPPVDILLNLCLDRALVHVIDSLRLERPAVLAPLEHARRVHGALQRVALPAKEVVGVGPEPLAVAVAEHKGVGAVSGPEAGELGGVPEGLVRDLGDAHGVGCWAGAGWVEGFFYLGGVRY